MKNTFFSGLYIYKLVLPEPANSQNEESKQVRHRFCSPPTGNTALQQAVQIQLLSLHNERRDFHISAFSAWKHCHLSPEISEWGASIPEVRFSMPSGYLAVFRNVVAQS